MSSGPAIPIEAHIAITAVSARDFALILISAAARPNTCATTPA